MKKIVVLGLVATASIVVAAVSSGVKAQGGPVGPGGPGGGPPPPMMGANQLVAGDSGLFIQLGPNLVRFDASTLAQTGSLAIEAAPTASSSSAKSGGQNGPPPPPNAEMLLVDYNDTEQILVVTSTKFIRIDATSFTLAVQQALPAVPAPSTSASQSKNMPPPPVGLKYNNGVLYVLRGPQILAVSIADGSVKATGELPKPTTK